MDVIVFDEAQIMTETTLEDMAAAQNVAANPLTFMMGTPPRPKDAGEVFTLLRQEALDGDSDGTLYVELSADRGADLLDRDQWRKANPSFPHRTTERAMLRLRKKLKNDDSWRREALGIWDEITKQFSPINGPLWADGDGRRPLRHGTSPTRWRSTCPTTGRSASARAGWKPTPRTSRRSGPASTTLPRSTGWRPGPVGARIRS